MLTGNKPNDMNFTQHLELSPNYIRLNYWFTNLIGQFYVAMHMRIHHYSKTTDNGEKKLQSLGK